ncbi:hypothetical protein [Clostridium estertheticum]|uniref:hypothetical protein n=1 Tax=Clostridium estertheticum TaxID=238834 RepID=UPI001CF35C63|nr:hypothetical protein [Clostridium estertheticum]MCB2339093.1 hypothetical protein [Clostridium estertheticum]
MSKMYSKAEAINNNNNLISNNRKQFLLSRLLYWDEFGRSKGRGIISTSDLE